MVCRLHPISSRESEHLLAPLHLDDKKKSTDTPSTNSVRASPDPVVNQLDDTARETFATGRPLEDSLELHQCKHCKRSVLKTELKGHVVSCLKLKKEKAQRKKEQKEAREREKKEMDGEKKDGDGDTRMDDDDDLDDDASPEKKRPGGLKSAKKSAGKVEIDDATKKGKKRKADGDAEKGPKQKKKKEEPKPKAPKPKGIPHFLNICDSFLVSWFIVQPTWHAPWSYISPIMSTLLYLARRWRVLKFEEKALSVLIGVLFTGISLHLSLPEPLHLTIHAPMLKNR
jgi:hypothetical protein